MDNRLDKNDIDQVNAMLKEKNWCKIIDLTATEGIFLTENGYVIEANNVGCKMYGYPYEEMVGLQSIDAFVDDSKKIILEKVKQKYVGFYRVTALRKNGTTFPVEINAKNISYKGKDARLVIIHDITKRIEAENLIREQENKFKTLFENAGDGIIIGDLKGNMVDVNSRILNMIGCNRNGVINKRIENIFSKNSLNKHPLRYDKVLSGKAIIVERELLRNDGSIIPIEMNTTLLENKYYISIFRDLTDRKKTENALIEKNRELLIAKKRAEESDLLKSEFLSNMSHEIRTPMNGIMGFADLLESNNLDAEQQKFYISIIKNSGNQLLRIIEDIIEISKLETKQVKVINKPLNLNSLLLELFTLYEKQAKENKTPLNVNYGLADNESTIMVDESKLRKVFNNLIDNALRYSNSGCIEIGYSLQNNQNILFYVKDSGIGIDTEKQQIIFERFSQAEKHLSKEYGGLGLGLSIAKENTELMGGSISVKSEKGKGSAFYFTVPYKLA